MSAVLNLWSCECHIRCRCYCCLLRFLCHRSSRFGLATRSTADRKLVIPIQFAVAKRVHVRWDAWCWVMKRMADRLEVVLRWLSALLQLLYFAKSLLGILNGLVSFLLKLVNPVVEELLLGLSLHFELIQLGDVLVLQVRFIEDFVSSAQLFNAFKSLLFDWVIIKIKFDNRFVHFHRVFYLFAWLVPNQVVPHVQLFKCCVLVSHHFDEIGSDVFAADLAFWNIKFLETKRNLVSIESLGNFTYGLLDWVLLKDQGL